MISTIDFEAAAQVEDGEAAPSMFGGYDDLLTVADMCQILRVNEKAVQRLCKRGEVPAVRIGRRWYVPRAAFIDFVTRPPR